MASGGEKDKKEKVCSGNLMINGGWDMEIILKSWKTKEKHKIEKFTTTSPTTEQNLTNKSP